MNDKQRKTAGSLGLLGGVAFLAAAWVGQDIAFFGVALLLLSFGLEALRKPGVDRLE